MFEAGCAGTRLAGANRLAPQRQVANSPELSPLNAPVRATTATKNSTFKYMAAANLETLTA